MERKKSYPSFVTEPRIERAVCHANALAFDDPSLTAHHCAAMAVREVFGPWIAQPDGTIRMDCLPLFFRLSGNIESRLGLHRVPRTTYRGSTAPARIERSDPDYLDVGEFIGMTAIAI